MRRGVMDGIYCVADNVRVFLLKGDWTATVLELGITCCDRVN